MIKEILIFLFNWILFLSLKEEFMCMSLFYVVFGEIVCFLVISVFL